MVVGKLLYTKLIDLPSNLNLIQYKVIFSNKLISLRVVFDAILALKYQIDAVKNNAIGCLTNITKTSKFIDRKSKL